METTVNNLLTGERLIFVNNYSPKDNIINAIILNSKQTSNLLNNSLRIAISHKYEIIEKTSKNGDNIAFGKEINLFSRQKTNP